MVIIISAALKVIKKIVSDVKPNSTFLIRWYSAERHHDVFSTYISFETTLSVC